MISRAVTASSRPGFAQHLAQRAALDQLHDQEDHVAVPPLIGDGDHVRVRQPGRGLGLAPEAGDEVLVGGERRMHHLHGDRAVEPGVESGVNDGHSALREPSGDLVATVEQPAQ